MIVGGCCTLSVADIFLLQSIAFSRKEMPAKGFEFSLMLSTNGACGKPVFSSASTRHLQEFVARGAPSSRVRFDTGEIPVAELLHSLFGEILLFNPLTSFVKVAYKRIKVLTQVKLLTCES